MTSLHRPNYIELVKFSGPCDRKQHYEMCMPAIALNKSIYTPAGTGGPRTPQVAQTYLNISYKCFKPTTWSDISALLERKQGVSINDEHTREDHQAEAGAAGPGQAARVGFAGLQGDGLFAG